MLDRGAVEWRIDKNPPKNNRPMLKKSERGEGKEYMNRSEKLSENSRKNLTNMP